MFPIGHNINVQVLNVCYFYCHNLTYTDFYRTYLIVNFFSAIIICQDISCVAVLHLKISVESELTAEKTSDNGILKKLSEKDNSLYLLSSFNLEGYWLVVDNKLIYLVVNNHMRCLQ